jgi:hypothetical protein
LCNELLQLRTIVSRVTARWRRWAPTRTLNGRATRLISVALHRLNPQQQARTTRPQFARPDHDTTLTNPHHRPTLVGEETPMADELV